MDHLQQNDSGPMKHSIKIPQLIEISQNDAIKFTVRCPYTDSRSLLVVQYLIYKVPLTVIFCCCGGALTLVLEELKRDFVCACVHQFVMFLKKLLPVVLTYESQVWSVLII